MKIYRYILLTIWTLTAGILAAGCSSRHKDEPEPGPGEFCELVISLSSETSVTDSPATRADQPWDNDPDPEDGFPSEYRIDRVLLYFVTPGNAIIPFSPTLTDRDDANNTVTYSTRIDVRSHFVSHNADGSLSLSGRIVAVANGPEDYTPADPFSRIPFAISDVDTHGLIPMWGVRTVTNLPLTVDGTSYAGEIKLLRAVSKITIEMADEFKDQYNIVSVEPNQSNYLTQGYIAPGGAAEATSTGALLMEGCYNPFLDATADTAPKFYNSRRKQGVGLSDRTQRQIWISKVGLHRDIGGKGPSGAHFHRRGAPLQLLRQRQAGHIERVPATGAQSRLSVQDFIKGTRIRHFLQGMDIRGQGPYRP